MTYPSCLMQCTRTGEVREDRREENRRAKTVERCNTNGEVLPGQAATHMNSKKTDASRAYSHDLSREANKFCQDLRKTHFGDIQIHTLTTTCAGHSDMARALPMIQA